MGQLEGMVVLVTDASSGIGRATTHLAQEGATTVVLARREESPDAAAIPAGDRAVPIPTDVGDPQAVNAASERVAERFGVFHAPVNGAGMGRCASSRRRATRTSPRVRRCRPARACRAARRSDP